MKRNQLLVLSVLVFGLQGVAQASPYPADAEASLGLPGVGDRATAWGVSEREGKSNDPFPVGIGFTAE